MLHNLKAKNKGKSIRHVEPSERSSVVHLIFFSFVENITEELLNISFCCILLKPKNVTRNKRHLKRELSCFRLS